MTPWGGLWRFEFDRATIIAGLINETYGLFRANGNQYQLLSKESMKEEGGIRKENDFHFLIPNS